MINQPKIPFPGEIQITPASVNDLTVFKEAWSEKTNRNFFGDKTYNNLDFFYRIRARKKINYDDPSQRNQRAVSRNQKWRQSSK
jgi:hypothetical protein